MRRNTCAICRAPITQPKTGRPRKTCSDRCRQRLHRRRHPRTLSQIEVERELRFIQRTVERLERKHGPPPPDDPTLYARIGLRLNRGLPVRTCPECGHPFIIYGAPGPIPKYCSKRCKGRVNDRAYRKRKRGHVTAPRPYDDYEADRINLRLRRGIPVSTCPECGRYFIHDGWLGRPPKYCSKRCRQRAWRHNRRPLYRTCHQCGERYRVNLRNRDKQKYCSSRCQNRAASLRRRRRNAATK